MEEVLLEAVLDSLKGFVAILIFHIAFSFAEEKISKQMNDKHGLSPLLGSLFGLIPQCGFSVIASDMYLKEHITMGTLLAVFIACSDEALPIMLTDLSKSYLVLPIIAIKFVVGFVVGYVVDLIIRKSNEKVHEHLEHCHHEPEVHVGCCNHEIDNEKTSPVQKHLIHPLIHSLKILLYIFIFNLLFGILIYFIGEDTFASFLESGKYLGPLFAVLIGLIPNCVSSVIIANLLLAGNISFGTALAGLIVNCGLGSIILLKNKEKLKNTLIIFGVLILVAVISGYVTCLITGF